MKSLACFFSPHLRPWEKASVLQILDGLKENVSVVSRDFGKYDKGLLSKGSVADAVWIVSTHWDRAVQLLSASRSSDPITVSVFGAAPNPSILTILWKQTRSILPKNTRLLTHSRITYEFYRQIGSLPDARCGYLPLPPLDIPLARRELTHARPIVVGSFASFAAHKNIHFLLAVAHATLMKSENLQFKIFGSGPLIKHYQRIVDELGLSPQLTLTETQNLSLLGEIDIFLYAPLLNRHFIHLLAAACAKIPVLTCELPGMEEYVTPSLSGEILPVHDVNRMAQCILELVQNPEKRKKMGDAFYKNILDRFSVSKIAPLYESFFFNPGPVVKLQAA